MFLAAASVLFLSHLSENNSNITVDNHAFSTLQKNKNNNK